MSPAYNINARVELELSGRKNGWTDRSLDVDAKSGIDCYRGMPGGGPLDRVAEPGTANLAFTNSAANSDGLLGRFSPGHANKLPGFGVGTGLRIAIVIGDGWCTDDWSEEWSEFATEHVIWTGHIVKIEPEPDQYAPVLSFVEAQDYMGRLLRAAIPACDIQVGVNEADAVSTIIEAMGVAPRDTEITDGPDTYEYALDQVRAEGDSPIAELQRVGQSSYSTMYVRSSGLFKYEPRNERRASSGTLPSVAIALDEDDLRVGRVPDIIDNTLDRVTRVRGLLTPREVDGEVGSEVVLFALTDPIPFPTGETVISFLYTDPDDRGLRAGGVQLLTPAENTDYDFNTEIDGTGTDVSGSVSVSASFCGDFVTFTIDNSAGATVYPVTPDSPGPSETLLQVRGVAIIAKEEAIFEATSTPSADAGEVTLTVNMAYLSSVEVAQAYADWLRDTLADDERQVVSVPLHLDNADTDRAATIAALEISDRFTLAETVTGITASQSFWINGIGYEISEGAIWPSLLAAPVDAGFEVEFGGGHLTTSGVTSPADDIDSPQTAQVTTSPGYLQCLWVSSKNTISTNPVIPGVTTPGLTWSQVATIVYDPSGVDRKRLTLFAALSASAVVNQRAVFDYSAQSQGRVSWSWAEFETTAGTAGAAIVQSVTDSASGVSSRTTNLAAFADAANRPACGWSLDKPDSLEHEGTWAKLGSRNKAESMLTANDPSNADTSCTVTVPGSAGSLGAIAIEIKKD